ncbi:MAG: class I SAM-dependent methyltransferase [Syntrophales bacterium]|nr:class I SAM-dependent methyltransferase [Syntrophales bacterium]
MIFSEEIARSYDDWLQTPIGCYIDGREKELILALTVPRDGERLLDVGCGTGEHLLLFREKGCDVTGIEPSPFMLEVAKQKLGNRADFHKGKAEDLPFSDNEFDIVTLITSLEFADDPEKAISEAIRVSRDRVFLGVLNKYSLLGAQRRLKLFGPSVYHSARFFHIAELTTMVRNQLRGVHIKWGSVIFLPYGCYKFARVMEESIPVMKNPFGAFVGLSFPVTFMYRTVQDIIRKPFKIKAESRYPARGIVKEMKE